MNCESLVTLPPSTVGKASSVADAIHALAANGYGTLPVVDHNGIFAGVFGAKELLGLMLPRAARLDENADLGFVNESVEDLRQRLASVATEPVGKYAAPHRTIRPATALVEAVLLLQRGDAFLPVVDDTGRLVGVVTAANALASLTGGA